MRASPILLALPALGAAQQQAPLLDQVKGWFAKATDGIASALPTAVPAVSMPAAPSIPNPVASGAAKVAALKVDTLTVENYQGLLHPGAATATPDFEEWMVFVTGGNKTCFGRCQRAETAFNESVPLLAASPTAPHLAMLDCESQGVLCNAWAVNAPSILHMLLPQPLADQSVSPSIVRSMPLNRTTVTAGDIAAIHIQETYKKVQPYEGFWHPFDGPLAQYGLAIPVGYLIWGFSLVPSWAFMIAISFFSRTVMSRRLPQDRPAGAAAAAPAN